MGIAQMEAFAVITGTRKYDLELQIICTDKAQASREVKDLKKNYGMDDARVKRFDNETLVYEWIEKNA